MQRTSTFLAVTTFGTAGDAQRAVDRVRGIHRRVHGIAPDGRTYRADDPHLLEWVHIAEVDSFLLAYQRYGAAPLDQDGRDAYDKAMLDVLKGSSKQMAAPELGTAVGGTPLQVRTSLARLIQAGKVSWTGKARGTRYKAL